MLEVFDRELTKLAVLEHAHERTETHALNGVGSFSFRLPGDDPKTACVRPFGFVRNDGGDMYRLLADGETIADDTGIHAYEAEHAIATLVDDVMFGTHLIGGLGIHTRGVIEYILEKQTVRHWVLGDCEFDKQFEYGYESENLLNALFAVPNLFVEPYRWEMDMRSYPWTLHLRRLDTAGEPQFFLRAGKNLIAGGAQRSGAEVCTRLYLLGYGEGDNQLTISEVNGGLPYLQSPQEYIDRYGLISKVYVDRMFEDAASLLERGRALLSAMQEPQYRRSFTVADLYAITQQPYDEARVGDRVRLTDDETVTYITGIRRNLDTCGDMVIEMATSPRDIAQDIADIAARQRIEQVYAQGATQIYAQSVQANATQTTPAVLNFFIPTEMRIINKVVAKISLDRFRSYSRVTSGGGKAATTSSAGGGSVATSAVGGGSSVTSASGGEVSVSSDAAVTLDSGVGFTTDASSIAVTEGPHPSYPQVTGAGSGATGGPSAASTGSAGAGYTSSASGGTGAASTNYTAGANGATGTHVHQMAHTHSLSAHQHQTGGHTHSIAHTHAVGSHTHGIGAHRHYMAHTHTLWHQHKIPGHTHKIAAHTHRVGVPEHTHDVGIPGHTHRVDLPDHTHEITQGIYRFGKPTAAAILVNGQEKLAMGEEREVDLTEYLVGASGKIPRGSWIRLGVLPNDLAYVTIDLVVQGFVQSRGGIHA